MTTAAERSIAWQTNNRDKHNEHVKKYAANNPEVGKAAYKRWVEKNRGTLTYAQRDMLNRSKERAKRKGYEYNLVLEDIVAIWPVDNICPALGIEFDLSRKNRWHSPSLDRIDSSKGYTKDNIVIVSYRANSIKQDSTLNELRMLLDFYEPLITCCQDPCDRPICPT